MRITPSFGAKLSSYCTCEFVLDPNLFVFEICSLQRTDSTRTQKYQSKNSLYMKIMFIQLRLDSTLYRNKDEHAKFIKQSKSYM